MPVNTKTEPDTSANTFHNADASAGDEEPTPELVRETALAANAVGLCVVPVKETGEKFPDTAWAEYQKTRTTREQVEKWFSLGRWHRKGVGLICGGVSGGLELLDFDNPEIFTRFKADAMQAGLGELLERLSAGYHELTPNGEHLLYYCDELRGNTKLAERPDGFCRETGVPLRKALIETRGEGGFVVIAPSHGGVHPSGKPYRLVRGSVNSIATITSAERDTFWDLARTYDEIPKPQDPPKSRHSGHRKNGPTAGLRPGDDFNARTTWSEVLEPHGWVHVYDRGDESYWRRPGKTEGVSATTNYQDSDLLWVFSTSTGLEPERSYDKFGAYAHLNHGPGEAGLSAAAKELSQQGYGDPPGSRQSSSQKGSTTGNDSAEDDDSIPVVDSFPEPPHEAVYHGLLGQIVAAVAPHSEADPIAILVQLLAAIGSLIGRTAYFVAEADQHYCNEYFIIIGRTSKGRKGSSWSQARRFVATADPHWLQNCIQDGLSTGEGLIFAIRDPLMKREAIKDAGGKITGYKNIEIDAGVENKNLLIVEPEFGTTLKTANREGNSLTGVLRKLWDRGEVRTLTKNSPLRTSNAHVSIIGHTTDSELRQYLSDLSASNGFGNRFLYVCVRRSKLLPFGGSVDQDVVRVFREKIKLVVEFARKQEQMVCDDGAKALWKESYAILSEGKPGLLGALTGRAEAHVLRIAMLYALIDQSKVIREEHLLASLALWSYVERSVRFVFGDSLGDPDADRLLAALRAAPNGLSRENIRSLVFAGHKTSAAIREILGRLLGLGLVRSSTTPTGGRPVEFWFACDARA